MCFYDHASDYHLSERGVECFEIENQVQFAHVLEKAVKGLHENLDEIEKGQRGLSRGGDDDEVEGRIVAVGNERGSVVVRGGGGRRFAAVGEERWKAEWSAGTGIGTWY